MDPTRKEFTSTIYLWPPPYSRIFEFLHRHFEVIIAEESHNMHIHLFVYESNTMFRPIKTITFLNPTIQHSTECVLQCYTFVSREHQSIHTLRLQVRVLYSLDCLFRFAQFRVSQKKKHMIYAFNFFLVQTYVFRLPI